MRTVGLTGGIACGKSTVAGILRDLGVPVIDADQASRAVVAPGTPGLEQVIARFGGHLLRADGSLDRAALGTIVFADAQARRDLEAITHPLIRSHVVEWMLVQAQAGVPACVVEAALLVETGGYKLYDELIVVRCRPETQLARLLGRDELSPEQARARVDAQLPMADKVAVATELIDNDGDPGTLGPQVRAAWARILARGA